MMTRLSASWTSTLYTALPYALLGAVLIGAAAFKLTTLPQNTIILPIEVYPPDGFRATTPNGGDETVTIHVPDANAVDSLGFRMHQPFYHQGGTALSVQEGFEVEGAAAISVNGGPFVDITGDVIDCAFPERNMQCLSGQAPTVRFAVPKNISGNLITGENTVTFRYNGTKGVRSGYRVIGLAALGGSTTIQTVDWLEGGLLADGATRFQWDDPRQWTAPRDGDPAKGEVLFTARNTLEDHLNQENPSFPGDPITASCADCHAKDGMDLWYFNYSNETIIARSRFHGLSEQDGKDIAAYIRSLDYQTAEGASYDAPGRPWNPPFQPGPTYGLDGTGVNAWDELTDDESHYWAAGAGLDDVLDYAIDEIKYMWPAGGDPGTGVPPSGIDYFYDATTGKNELAWEKFSMRGITDHKKYPIQLQFPDWNMWLPDVSPVGDFDSCDIRSWSSSSGDNPYADYEDMVGDPQSTSWGGSQFAGRNHDNPTQLRFTTSKINSFSRAVDAFKRSCNGKGASTTKNMHEDQGLMGWAMIRIWEAFQYFDLYDHADKEIDYYLTDSEVDQDLKDWDLDIGMFGTGRQFFDAAPHIMGNVMPGNGPYHYGTHQGQLWSTHAWYQIQITLDPGVNPGSGAGNPIDWHYQDGWMATWGVASGLDITPRQFKSQSLRWQEAYDPEVGVAAPSGADALDKPWRARLLWAKQSQPVRLHGLAARLTGRLGNGFSKWAKGTRDRGQLSQDMLTAFYRAWWDGYKQFPISDFQTRAIGPPAGDRKNGDVWETQAYVPSAQQSLYLQRYISDFYYQGLHRAAEAGAAPGVIDSIATRWASPMWPEANEQNYQRHGLPYAWEQIANYTAPTSSSQSVSLSEGWNLASSHIAPSPSTLDNLLSGISELSVMVDANGNLFIPGESNAIGDWRPEEAYKIYMTSPRTITLEGTPLAPQSPLSLEQGWNLVAYLPREPLSPAAAFASIEDHLVIAKDADGGTYIPELGVDTIGLLQPGQGYRVFVTEPVELTYPDGASSN